MSFNESTVDLGGLFISNKIQLQHAAMKILGCRERAEDVVQEAYLKVVETASRFNIKQPLAYVFQIVRNLAIDKHRRSNFEIRVFVDEEEGLDVHMPTDTPEALAICRQHLRLASDALSKLPERTRRAFELYLLNGLTQKEIASQLGVSITLVNFMIREAFTRCRLASKFS